MPAHDADSPERRAASEGGPPSGMPEGPLAKARRYLDERRGERVTLQQLARAAGWSPSHLQRRFKRAFGLTPREYQREHRLAEAKQLLANGSSVTRALFEAGYGSVSRFYETGTRRLGMRAREYRAGGRGIEIAYAVFPSPLGLVLAASTARGLCALKLGDDRRGLVRALEKEFNAARLAESPGALRRIRAAVLEYVAGNAALARIPLDLRGTVFQRRVWQALRAIPHGQTRSYRQIAASMGVPAAARAVGRACGANPVALAVPCHRAVRADGKPGGYAWGVERKQRLLALEAQGTKRTRGTRKA